MIDKPTGELSPTLVLLCVGGAAHGHRHPAYSPLFGNIWLYHQIEQLRRLGVADVAIAVETIPPEFPVLVERMDQAGFRLRILRTARELADAVSTNDRVIVKSGDVHVADSLLRDVLTSNTPAVYRLPEQPEHVRFERIDLASRWAGLAMLKGSTVKQTDGIADGWSIDSALLRQALQAGVKLADIPPKAVIEHRLIKIATTTDLPAVELALLPVGEPPDNPVDKAIWRGARRLLPSIWRSGWVRRSVEHSLPVLGVLVLLLAWFALPALAALAAVAGMAVAPLRALGRTAEYRGGADIADILFRAALALALALALWRDGEAPLDATFLTLLSVVALTLPLDKPWAAARVTALPLAILLGLASLGGVLTPALKIALLALFGLHGITAAAARRRPRLNAN